MLLKILKVLYPNWIKPEQYRDMLAVTRIVDKLFRIATQKEAFGENNIFTVSYASLAENNPNVMPKNRKYH